MSVKEKLIELLKRTEYQFTVTHSLTVENVADDLVTNGVTMQEWISVKDRLPEYEEPVMGWDAEMRDMGIVNFIYGKFFDILDMSETNVTHWMPLPPAPEDAK